MNSQSANTTINELRQRTGLSQGKFAKRYHLSVRTLQRWEQKQTKTPEFVLFALKTILDLEERLNVKHSD